MSGYIALNAISFSVCRPHKAFKCRYLQGILTVSGRKDMGQERRNARIKNQGNLDERHNTIYNDETHLIQLKHLVIEGW